MGDIHHMRWQRYALPGDRVFCGRHKAMNHGGRKDTTPTIRLYIPPQYNESHIRYNEWLCTECVEARRLADPEFNVALLLTPTDLEEME